MVNYYKIAISAIVFLVIFAIACVLIMGFIGSSGSGGTMYLHEVPEERLDTVLAPQIKISDADFRKYPELKELFDNIDTNRGEFISEVYVQPGRYKEIYYDYIPGLLCWNGGYYTILATHP
ncbi:hypothetical protein Mpet_1543 [Methanolacinia petrolearia DSM 11571]|uniref:Uncharacterized protein n=1 Tax=Methanolacinia petrolearia (strain DSM 11571 / OCM 486 / SEBR 4847) TaxID=679926 RepID=E1RG65_METP4|nr:hypothetical protein [Methanolacinia petrolearia]ADN36300.1 hypothetical protein Mpet_1543 [Methanolacinia petrolearia DSM 11571]